MVTAMNYDQIIQNMAMFSKFQLNRNDKKNCLLPADTLKVILKANILNMVMQNVIDIETT